MLYCASAPMARLWNKDGVMSRNSVSVELGCPKYYYFVPYPKNKQVSRVAPSDTTSSALMILEPKTKGWYPMTRLQTVSLCRHAIILPNRTL